MDPQTTQETFRPGDVVTLRFFPDRPKMIVLGSRNVYLGDTLLHACICRRENLATSDFYDFELVRTTED
jgi:hypothetical protein